MYVDVYIYIYPAALPNLTKPSTPISTLWAPRNPPFFLNFDLKSFLDLDLVYPKWNKNIIIDPKKS